MNVVATALPGVVIVESPVHTDDRGAFTEVFHEAKFRALGLPLTFRQDNHSRSKRNVLRGLHFQRSPQQGKLVRVTAGRVFDVAVDIRKGSSSFGQWIGTVLEEDDGRQLYIPPGFAHGFLVLSDSASVSYKCTELYDRDSDSCLLWNDAAIGIAWPLESGATPLLSAKDMAGTPLANLVPLP